MNRMPDDEPQQNIILAIHDYLDHLQTKDLTDEQLQAKLDNCLSLLDKFPTPEKLIFLDRYRLIMHSQAVVRDAERIVHAAEKTHFLKLADKATIQVQKAARRRPVNAETLLEYTEAKNVYGHCKQMYDEAMSQEAIAHDEMCNFFLRATRVTSLIKRFK